MRDNRIMIITNNNEGISVKLSNSINGCLDSDEYLDRILKITTSSKDICSDLSKLRKNSNIMFKDINIHDTIRLSSKDFYINNFYIINKTNDYITVKIENKEDNLYNDFDELTLSPLIILILSLKPIIKYKGVTNPSKYKYVIERADIRA